MIYTSKKPKANIQWHQKLLFYLWMFDLFETFVTLTAVHMLDYIRVKSIRAYSIKQLMLPSFNSPPPMP